MSRRRRAMRSKPLHEHWFAERWSSYVSMAVGLIFWLFPHEELIYWPSAYGFYRFSPNGMWIVSFVLIGLIQFIALQYQCFKGRGLAAGFSSFLYLWGFLNVLVYGHEWHLSLVLWFSFAAINLYALSRILRGVEQAYEFHGTG